MGYHNVFLYERLVMPASDKLHLDWQAYWEAYLGPHLSYQEPEV